MVRVTQQQETQTPTAALIEHDDSSQLAVEYFQSERMSLVYPFFLLNKVKKIEIGNPKKGSYFAVKPHQDFTIPRDFARRVHRQIVEKCFTAMPRPLPDVIPLGSIYTMAKTLGLKNLDGAASERIKEAFRGIRATTIQAKGTGEFLTSLYHEVYFSGETLPNGTPADQVYIVPARWYREKFNTNQIRNIQSEFYDSLPSNQQRLYELIGAKFYGLYEAYQDTQGVWKIRLKNKSAPYINYKYSTTCGLFPLIRKPYFSKDVRLAKAVDGLKDKGFFSDRTTYDKLGKDSFGEEWMFYYYAGEVALAEIATFLIAAAQAKLQQPALSTLPKLNKSKDEIEMLVYEQLEILKDEHSKAMYFKIATYCPTNAVSRILHEVKSEHLEDGTVRDLRQLYMHRIKLAFPELFPDKEKSTHH